MNALSQLFESTILLVPCSAGSEREGEVALTGHRLSVAPLSVPPGSGQWRKVGMLLWTARNLPTLWRRVRRADAVHVAIPGDVGTIGMLLAFALRKPLFVRHCGNWRVQRTAAERFWKWFMERFAGGRNVMLATGGDDAPPSVVNPELAWIFSTSMTQAELAQVALPRDAPEGRHRLITVSRLEKEKGTGIVLRALALLRELLPNPTLDIVGDGNALPALRREAEALGIADRVVFHGRVDHAAVLRLLRQADVFCYPTAASEGFPKVVLEALACGLPVVTTRVSVLPGLLAGGCGLLLDDGTPESLAHAVGTIAADPNRYRAMSARAVETARRYSLESWRGEIGERLQRAWGPLRAQSPA